MTNLIVKAKVKDFVVQAAGENMSVASDFADSLNDEVQELVKRAIARARANGRKTIMAKDV
ncbi:MAG: DUF1931 domain-containing protein [Candidatus Woesearchaeota archaeon]